MQTGNNRPNPHNPESDLLKPLRDVRETLDGLPARFQTTAKVASDDFWQRGETAGIKIASLLGAFIIIAALVYAAVRNKQQPK